MQQQAAEGHTSAQPPAQWLPAIIERAQQEAAAIIEQSKQHQEVSDHEQ